MSFLLIELVTRKRVGTRRTPNIPCKMTLSRVGRIIITFYKYCLFCFVCEPAMVESKHAPVFFVTVSCLAIFNVISTFVCGGTMSPLGPPFPD